MLVFEHLPFCAQFPIAVVLLRMLLRIPTTVVDAYPGSIAPVREKVDKFNEKLEIAAMMRTPETSGSGSSGAKPDGDGGSGRRLACRPVFGADETPVNTSRTVLPSQILSKAEFESTLELLDAQVTNRFVKMCSHYLKTY